MVDLEDKTTALYSMDLNLEISMFCEVVNIQITKADPKKEIYEGKVTTIDHLEHGIRFTDNWKAYPGLQKHEVFDKQYWMIIECTDKHYLIPKKCFTLQPSVDNDIKHFIMHAILEYRPDLKGMK